MARGKLRYLRRILRHVGDCNDCNTIDMHQIEEYPRTKCLHRSCVSLPTFNVADTHAWMSSQVLLPASDPSCLFLQIHVLILGELVRNLQAHRFGIDLTCGTAGTQMLSTYSMPCSWNRTPSFRIRTSRQAAVHPCCNINTREAFLLYIWRRDPKRGRLLNGRAL